jgi:hypothetical protein
MARPTSHDRKKERPFSGERYAAQVVDFFNLLPREKRLGASAKARVVDVIKATRALNQAMREDPHWFRNKDSALQSNGVIIANPSEAVSRAMIAINAKLSKYPTFPMFSPDPRAMSLMAIGHGQAGKPSATRCMELFAVHAVVHLADAGLLDRLQTCACGKWYFARFSHQRFCSPECRVTFWESSEERKEQKRKRARQNYVHNKIRDRGKRR